MKARLPMLVHELDSTVELDHAACQTAPPHSRRRPLERPKQDMENIVSRIPRRAVVGWC